MQFSKSHPSLFVRNAHDTKKQNAAAKAALSNQTHCPMVSALGNPEEVAHTKDNKTTQAMPSDTPVNIFLTAIILFL
ncbi:hypothetical protein [Bacteroides heparinolyticus]